MVGLNGDRHSTHPTSFSPTPMMKRAIDKIEGVRLLTNTFYLRDTQERRVIDFVDLVASAATAAAVTTTAAATATAAATVAATTTAATTTAAAATVAAATTTAATIFARTSFVHDD